MRETCVEQFTAQIPNSWIVIKPIEQEDKVTGISNGSTIPWGVAQMLDAAGCASSNPFLAAVEVPASALR